LLPGEGSGKKKRGRPGPDEGGPGDAPTPPTKAAKGETGQKLANHDKEEEEGDKAPTDMGKGKKRKPDGKEGPGVTVVTGEGMASPAGGAWAAYQHVLWELLAAWVAEAGEEQGRYPV
jgi:hypothetical protein